FEQYLQQFDFAAPHTPVISNITARPYQAADIRANLVNQICSSVQWVDTVRYLMGKGVGEIIEVGPGQVLTKLVDTIRKVAAPLVEADTAVAQAQSVARVAAAVVGFSAEGLGARSF